MTIAEWTDYLNAAKTALDPRRLNRRIIDALNNNPLVRHAKNARNQIIDLSFRH
jgi:hypothetical protein